MRVEWNEHRQPIRPKDGDNSDLGKAGSRKVMNIDSDRKIQFMNIYLILLDCNRKMHSMQLDGIFRNNNVKFLLSHSRNQPRKGKAQRRPAWQILVEGCKLADCRISSGPVRR